MVVLVFMADDILRTAYMIISLGLEQLPLDLEVVKHNLKDTKTKFNIRTSKSYSHSG